MKRRTTNLRDQAEQGWQTACTSNRTWWVLLGTGFKIRCENGWGTRYIPDDGKPEKLAARNQWDDLRCSHSVSAHSKVMVRKSWVWFQFVNLVGLGLPFRLLMLLDHECSNKQTNKQNGRRKILKKQKKSLLEDVKQTQESKKQNKKRQLIVGFLYFFPLLYGKEYV